MLKLKGLPLQTLTLLPWQPENKTGLCSRARSARKLPGNERSERQHHGNEVLPISTDMNKMQRMELLNKFAHSAEIASFQRTSTQHY